MGADFPDQHREWRSAAEAHQQQPRRGKRISGPRGRVAILLPFRLHGAPPIEPQAPRLRQSDVTIEKLASLLASAAPKGLLVVRDELAGWLLGMNAYNDAARAFWIEAYGGRPYRVERQKSPEPIIVPHLVTSVTGGTQPDKLAALFKDADDGLLARFCWFWPERVPFALARQAPATDWASEALDRLRLLELSPASPPETHLRPLMVPLTDDVLSDLQEFGREMQNRQEEAGGLMRSAYGKARGTALRVSLILEYLWWSARPGMTPPPVRIPSRAFLAAAGFVAEYLMPMAERVYGDAAAAPADHGAATLARWIRKARPAEVHVRTLQREVRLPGLDSADAIHAACAVLMEAGWLAAPVKAGAAHRSRQAYEVNPKLREAMQ